MKYLKYLGLLLAVIVIWTIFVAGLNSLTNGMVLSEEPFKTIKWFAGFFIGWITSQYGIDHFIHGDKDE